MAAQEQVGALYSFALIETAALVPLSRWIRTDSCSWSNRSPETALLYPPVMVDRSSMVILDGHHRVSALKLLGWILLLSTLWTTGTPSLR